MATDIAFTLGMLALAGNSIPKNLKIFLTALAVIDDLCAIIVIAVFYTEEISLVYLVITASLFLLLLALNKLKVTFLWTYILIGIIMWFSLLHSGIHATLAGVLLAIALPSEKKNDESISNKVQHYLHFPVAFVIIPLFALVNTCIIFSDNWYDDLFSTISMGIIFGLFIGKPIGIFLFSWLAVSFGICQLPVNIKWKHILGAGMLAGIGFTMSIFICLLAFNDVKQIDEAKIAIIYGSSLSAIFGIAYLKIVSRTKIRSN
jgi:NhaA family Na+:H+ antiporter